MLASSNGSRTDPHSGYAHCRAISAGVALSSLSAAEAYAELMGTSILTAASTAKKPCQVHRSVVGSILYLGEGLLAVDRKRTEEQRLAATRRPRARRRGSLQEHTRQRRSSTINGGSKSAGTRRSARRRRRGACGRNRGRGGPARLATYCATIGAPSTAHGVDAATPMAPAVTGTSALGSWEAGRVRRGRAARG